MWKTLISGISFLLVLFAWCLLTAGEQHRVPSDGKQKPGKGATAAVTRSVYEPNIPEPKTRADLIKYWLPVTLDDRTAQKLLWISEGGTKVSRMSEDVCPYPNRPERYDHSPQVLCKESLWESRGYWEVEYSGWVVIGAVYEGASRKAQDGPCGLGENDSSWAVGWSGSCYQVWHNGENVDVQSAAGNIIGVYVDQPEGIISFFQVVGDGESKEVKLLHKYKTSFKQPLLPGVWVGTKSTCVIQKKPE